MNSEINVGTIDRILRVILGVALLSLFFTGPGTPLGLLGVIPLLTGILGFCPLYAVFGVSTCARRKHA